MFLLSHWSLSACKSLNPSSRRFLWTHSCSHPAGWCERYHGTGHHWGASHRSEGEGVRKPLHSGGTLWSKHLPLHTDDQKVRSTLVGLQNNERSLEWHINHIVGTSKQWRLFIKCHGILHNYYLGWNMNIAIYSACSLTIDHESCFIRYQITNDTTEVCQMIFTSDLPENVCPVAGKGSAWRHEVQISEAGFGQFRQHYQIPLVQEHEDWGVEGDVRGTGHHCTVPFKHHQASRCEGWSIGSRVCKENSGQ